MNQAQGWETLTAVALLGTDRQGTIPAIVEDALTPLLAQIDTTDTEGWILSAAGLLSAYQQAGQLLPKQERPCPEPCPSDPSVFASERCFPFFKMILGDEFKQALPEFLTLLSQNGQCAPPQYLPQLLDWGRTHREVNLVMAVLGQRGEWLARQNPDWSYAIATPQSTAATDYVALWETGDRTARLNLLKQWRQIDPDAAREQVASSWKQESAKDRAEFLACFELGLSLADEAFLDKALGDRGKDVRRTAAILLSTLPDSRLSNELGTLVQAYVQFKEAGKQLKPTVNLPNLEDEQWKPYEFLKQTALHPMQKKQGDRANLLTELIGFAPLSVWESVGSPQTLLGAIIRSDWELMFIEGWGMAAQWQHNLPWAEALLNWFCAQKTSVQQERIVLEAMGQLFRLLPAEWQAQWITDQLNEKSWDDYVLEEFLNQLPTPWSLDLSRALLVSVCQYLEKAQALGEQKFAKVKWSIVYRFKAMVYSLHSEVLMTDEASALERFYQDQNVSAFEEFWRILRFRQQMRQAVLDPPNP